MRSLLSFKPYFLTYINAIGLRDFLLPPPQTLILKKLSEVLCVFFSKKQIHKTNKQKADFTSAYRVGYFHGVMLKSE